MNVKSILTGFFLLLCSNFLAAQENEYRPFPVQFTFVYPLGTSGTNSINCTYNFSLNILIGHTGAINGAEIGGILNSNLSQVSGLQIGGIGNITPGNVKGMQSGGIVNISGNMNGVQLGGIVNIASGNIKGIQSGGVFNIAKQVNGIQSSGIVNVAAENKGLQIAGIANLSDSATVSVSGIANVNEGRLQGIQITGILNRTQTLNGVQIGLINVTDSIEKGLSIGLISIVKKGFYDELTFTVADYLNMGVSYKFGTSTFYTIYSAGMNFIEDQLWVAGFGFGHVSRINDRLGFQPEITGYGYFPMDFSRPVRDTYSTHLKFGLVRYFGRNLALSFSPSIYWAIKSSRETYTLYGYEQSPIKPVVETNTKNRNSRVEVGFGFSLEFHVL